MAAHMIEPDRDEYGNLRESLSAEERAEFEHILARCPPPRKETRTIQTIIAQLASNHEDPLVPLTKPSEE